MSPARAGDTPEAEAAPTRGQGDAPGEPGGAISTIRGDAAPEPAAPLPIADLRSWAVLLLARVQDGDTIDQARERSGSRVSRDTITRYAAQRPDWYRRLMDAQDAAMDGETISSRDVARAHALAEEERRHTLAMQASERYAHPYMRLGAEIRGDAGQGARLQVNVGLSFRLPPHPGAAPPLGHVVDGELVPDTDATEPQADAHDAVARPPEPAA